MYKRSESRRDDAPQARPPETLMGNKQKKLASKNAGVEAPKPQQTANLAPVAPQGAASPVPAWWSWVAALAGGLAGALAFNPVALRPLIVLAPLGCFLAVRWAPSPRGAMLRAWAFGWVYYFGALHWLLTVSNWAEPHILGVFGVALLGVYLGAYPALAGFALRQWFWTRCASLQFALFGSLWLLTEWFRTLGRLAVPLAELGHAWATVPWAIQIAQWLGELGVTFEVLYLAGVIFLAGRWWALRRSPDQAAVAVARRRLGRVVPALAVVAVLWSVVSALSLRGWDKRIHDTLYAPGAKLINVGLVQPNIPQDLKLNSYNPDVDETTRAQLQQQIRERTEAMLQAYAKGQYQLILLPETAYTELDFNLNMPLRNRVGEMVRKAGADVLVSASRLVNPTGRPDDYEFYNTAFFVHKDGSFDQAFYDKMRLVPFGESLPYFDMIPGMQSFVGIGSFNEGKSQTLFTSSGQKFGVLICFESTFSSMARGLARTGAAFLTVVTNDAWYGMSAGASSHHDLSLLRAVETRRWLLRCANTGISSIITPAGRIAEYQTPQGALTATLALGKQGFVQGSIAPSVYTGQTLFTRLGNAWMLAPALLLLAGLMRRRRAAAV